MDRDLAQTFHGIASLITPVRAPDKRSKHPNSDGHPLITRVDTRRCQHIQRRTFAFSNEIVTSHMVIFSLRVTYPDPLFEGRLPEAFCRRGTGAAPASEGLNATFVPGPYSGSLAGH